MSVPLLTATSSCGHHGQDAVVHILHLGVAPPRPELAACGADDVQTGAAAMALGDIDRGVEPGHRRVEMLEPDVGKGKVPENHGLGL